MCTKTHHFKVCEPRQLKLSHSYFRVFNRQGIKIKKFENSLIEAQKKSKEHLHLAIELLNALNMMKMHSC